MLAIYLLEFHIPLKLNLNELIVIDYTAISSNFQQWYCKDAKQNWSIVCKNHSLLFHFKHILFIEVWRWFQIWNQYWSIPLKVKKKKKKKIVQKLVGMLCVIIRFINFYYNFMTIFLYYMIQVCYLVHNHQCSIKQLPCMRKSSIKHLKLKVKPNCKFHAQWFLWSNYNWCKFIWLRSSLQKPLNSEMDH